MKKLILPLLLVGALVGCTNWERDTFNTLASAQSVINTAKADYRAGTLPQTQCVADIINKATAADTLAVNAMTVYEQEKVAGTDVLAQQAIVANEVADLGTLIAQVATLKTAACTGGK